MQTLDRTVLIGADAGDDAQHDAGQIHGRIRSRMASVPKRWVVTKVVSAAADDIRKPSRCACSSVKKNHGVAEISVADHWAKSVRVQISLMIFHARDAMHPSGGKGEGCPRAWLRHQPQRSRGRPIESEGDLRAARGTCVHDRHP